MDAIRTMFKTPEAIVYREIDLDLGLDIDVSCWISGSVIVTEYPKEYTYKVTIVFIVLKICKIIDWSWLWVFSPLWLCMALIIILVLVALVHGFLMR
ncbi:MAG: hypothetical protein K6A76_03860 [Oribacterium sp.]|nr:hypothetical protein [Oribacterium sp.]